MRVQNFLIEKRFELIARTLSLKESQNKNSMRKMKLVILCITNIPVSDI